MIPAGDSAPRAAEVLPDDCMRVELAADASLRLPDRGILVSVHEPERDLDVVPTREGRRQHAARLYREADLFAFRVICAERMSREASNAECSGAIRLSIGVPPLAAAGTSASAADIRARPKMRREARRTA